MTDLKAFLDMSLESPAAPVVPFTVPTPGAVSHKLTARKGRAKNFRSVGNEFMEVDYQRNNSTLITSDDNGAGKSTLLVWLPIFAIYGDTYDKKEKKGSLVNSINRKDCVVEFEFYTKGSEWKVRRGIKPDIFEIYQQVDDKWMLIESEAAKADYQKYLTNLVGVDQKMMENSIILGKSKFIPFTQMGLPDRRVMVEAIWDLGFFSVMNEDVKAALKAINADLGQLDTAVTLSNNQLTNAREMLEQIVASNAAMQQNVRDTYDSALELLTTLQTDLKSLEEQFSNLAQDYNDAVGKIDALTDKNNAKIQSYKDERFAGLVTRVEELTATYAAESNAAAVAGQKVMDEAQQTLTNKLGERETFEEQKKELTAKLSENDAALAASQALVNEQVKLLSQGDTFKAKFEAERGLYQKNIDDFHSMGTCPTCTQVVSEETKAGVAAKYQVSIDEVEKKLEAINARVADTKAVFDQHTATSAALAEERKPLITAYQDVEASLRHYLESLKPYEQELARARNALAGELAAIEGRGAQAVSQAKADVQKAIDEYVSQVTRDTQDELQALERTGAQIRENQEAMKVRITQHKSRIYDQEATVNALKRKLDEKPQDVTAQEEKIAGLQAELVAAEVARKEKDESRQDHEHLLFFLKDDQSKARIVALYLPFLNSKINEYLEAMNMFLQIDIDDKFDINVLNPDRKGQTIFSLSDGQRSRLNISIMLALRDVANLKASIQCNLLILDEVLENMSERGVQEVTLMLNNKFKQNNLFVITQREQEFQEYFQHNIRFGLRNGMTEVISKE